ncbi:hypothetical protein E3N88_03917 [Mikania micrantha]|uniref:Uncharacterized protein n=1 Tax=Mikania micrantha TaxID=192012 RepID=A0A5N6PSW2_9ASTR|nr:hypothetical protein E3N88_03917 [Mikania micrantha]
MSKNITIVATPVATAVESITDESTNSISKSKNITAVGRRESHPISRLTTPYRRVNQFNFKVQGQVNILLSDLSGDPGSPKPRTDGYTMFMHPYGSSAFTRLSIDERWCFPAFDRR